jgi:hypothetical protein
MALLDEPAELQPNFAMREPGPRPTLGELHRATPWVWLWCERCQHHAPLACAVAVILWGPGASSDKLRTGARCTGCGSKGATVQHLLFAIDRCDRSLAYTQRKVKPVSMFVKAEGPSRAKIHSDDPKHALGLAQYLRAIGYSAWIEDTNGNEIDEKALKMAIRSRHEDAPIS